MPTYESVSMPASAANDGTVQQANITSPASAKPVYKKAGDKVVGFRESLFLFDIRFTISFSNEGGSLRS